MDFIKYSCCTVITSSEIKLKLKNKKIFQLQFKTKILNKPLNIFFSIHIIHFFLCCIHRYFLSSKIRVLWSESLMNLTMAKSNQECFFPTHHRVFFSSRKEHSTSILFLEHSVLFFIFVLNLPCNRFFVLGV